MNPLKDPRRTRFLDRFDPRYKSDVANCFLRVLREETPRSDSEVCRQVWLNLKERSAWNTETSLFPVEATGHGSGTTPFPVFAAIARENPQLALDFCAWARAWDTLTPAEKDRARGKGSTHA